MAGVDALLCNTCNTGKKAEACVKCGRDVHGKGAVARLCAHCETTQKSKCAKCGAKLFGKQTPAKICVQCVATEAKCVKCGQRA